LAYDAGRLGGTAPAWLNAANEIAVEAFLDGRIAWGDISRMIAATLDHHDGAPATDAASIIDADAEARRIAISSLLHFSPPVGAPR
jgi:1-deoxy-D-xylulose-5-phosphate reductoisomerase